MPPATMRERLLAPPRPATHSRCRKWSMGHCGYSTACQRSLSAQLAIRAMRKTVEADKRDKRIQPTFNPQGAIAYDPRVKRAKRAKRHLKRLSGREARFRRATNHCISKHMVAKAQHSHQRIAREDLRHMRSRTERTVRKSQRQRPSSCSWAFCQLRAFS